MGDLDGQVAVVMGLDAGPARAVACALAERGASVAIADADGTVTAQVVAGIDELGGTPGLGVSADLTEGYGCRHTIDRVLETWGRIDVVISGVGLSAGDLPTARRFDRNCDGMLLLSRALVGANQQIRYRPHALAG